MGSPVYLFGRPGGAQAQPPPSFADTLFQRFMTGLQIAQTVKQANQESTTRQQAIEQNKLQLALLQHQIKGAELQEKVAPLNTQLEIAQRLQGLPGQQVPGQIPGLPGMANVPAELGGPGGYQQTAGTQSAIDVPRPPISVNLNAAFPGAGTMQVPIQTQSQAFQNTLRQRYLEGQITAQAEGAKAGAIAAAQEPYNKVDIPPGLVPGFQGGQADEKAIPLITSAMTQAGENARTDKTIKSNQTVAGLNLQATREQRKFEQANKLSDDFRTDTAPFTIMDDAYAKIKAAAATTPDQDPTGATDVAILYGYMKLLDPTSAVREGEVALAQTTQGALGRAITAYNNVINGQKLAPAARANFVEAARKTYEAAQPRLKMVEGRYQDRARSAGLDPKQFTFQGQGAGATTAGKPPDLVVVGGKQVPFSSLSPAQQQQVLSLMKK